MAKRSYLEEMRFVIGNNESSNDYQSINPVDVVSIGLFNWYGARALGLARNIVAIDPAGSEAALSTASRPLYAEITSGNNNAWNSFVPGGSGANYNALRTFLGLDASHQAQDSLALVDSESYSSQAKAVGITDAATQIYYADLYNQSPKQAQNIIAALKASGQTINLSNIHAFAMQNPVMKKYSTRRNWTYGELSDWQGTAPPEDPPVTPPVNPPNNNGGGNLPPADYALTDYIIIQNDTLIKYSVDTPLGEIWVQRNNIYLKKGV